MALARLQLAETDLHEVTAPQISLERLASALKGMNFDELVELFVGIPKDQIARIITAYALKTNPNMTQEALFSICVKLGLPIPNDVMKPTSNPGRAGIDGHFDNAYSLSNGVTDSES